MINDQSIQKIVEDVLLKEPKYQRSNLIYQLVWRVWEYARNDKKPLSALSPEAFIDLCVNFGTVESIVRARRKVLADLEKRGIKIDKNRYDLSLKHYQNYTV